MRFFSTYGLPGYLTLAGFLGLAAFPSLARAWPAEGVVICSGDCNPDNPILAGDGNGGALVFWTDYRSLQWPPSLYVHHVRADGVVNPLWPTGGLLVPGPDHATMTADESGGAFLGWVDAAGVYVQHVLATGALDPAWPSGGRLAWAAQPPQDYPALVSDGGGGVVIAWRRSIPDGGGGVLTSVWAQHLLASGEPDPNWPSGGVALSTLGDQHSDVRTVRDGASGGIVAWKERRSGILAIYVQRVLASGQLDPQWPPGGFAAGASPHPYYDVDLVSDAAGGAVAVWTNAGIGASAQHVLGTGTRHPGWPEAGLELCGAVGCFYQAVISDDAGGAMTAWLVGPDGESNTCQIYAQHVTAEGGLPWSTEPIFVADILHDDPSNAPQVAVDGGGGAMVTWPGWFGLSVSRVRPSGSLDPAWPAGGLRLTSQSFQSTPILADCAGGAITAWVNNGPSLRAQRINTQGEIVAVSVEDTRRGPRMEVSPHPARGAARIRFSLPRDGRASLAIYDVTGRRWSELIRGDLSAGSRLALWDGRGPAGTAPGGVYFARLETSAGVTSRRFVLTR